MRRTQGFIAILLCICMLTLTLVVFDSSAEAFTDIDQDHPLYEAANRLQQRGIVNGFDDGSLQPDKQMSRVAALKVALTSVGSAPLRGVQSSSEVPSFTDIDQDQWYIPYLSHAHDLGIIQGYNDGTFRPEREVTQAEYLALLMRAAAFDASLYDREVIRELTALPDDAWYTPLYGYLLLTDRWPDELQMTPDAAITRGDAILLTNSLLWQVWSSDQEEAFPLPSVSHLQDASISLTPDDFLEPVEEPSSPPLDQIETPADSSYIYGRASYYGPGFAGRSTASGEIFDPNQLTAAHKSLPFGTLLRVENVHTGDFVNVRINDRGPFIAGRILDLSTAAFSAIAPLSQGIVDIRYTIIGTQN